MVMEMYEGPSSDRLNRLGNLIDGSDTSITEPHQPNSYPFYVYKKVLLYKNSTA